jgi:hypothetical protein
VKYSVDPPEFEKYIKLISYSDNKNVLLINVELRAKRIPFFPQIELDNNVEYTNVVEFVFDTFEYGHSNIVYPPSLGKWAGHEKPILKFELDDIYHIQTYGSGRYTYNVILSKNLDWVDLK